MSKVTQQEGGFSFALHKCWFYLENLRKYKIKKLHLYLDNKTFGKFGNFLAESNMTKLLFLFVSEGCMKLQQQLTDWA